MASPKRTGDDLVAVVARFYDDPLGYVLFAFPWGERGTYLEQEAGPDDWQREVLESIAKEIRAGRSAGEAARKAIRIAVKSGHGVGKTALVAWIILWFLSTRPHPQVVVTANTKPQLEGKTWRELSKWHQLAVNGGWFKKTATKFYAVDHPDTWFAMCVPWTKENSEAFAGTHERHVLIVFDEASSIDDIIWEVAEGAMTTPGAMWLVFGNPTRNTGRFRECWRRFKHRWTCHTVDARTAKMANKAEIAEWLNDYGEDSDFARVRAYGEFPRVASTQFIGEEMVVEAAKREPEPIEYKHAPIIYGLDVARFGDDHCTLIKRQGRKLHGIWRWYEVDTHFLAWDVAQILNEGPYDQLFIEEVGIGVGVLDTLNANGYQVQGVIPQARAGRPREYHNKRSEMWGEARLWLRDGGCPAIDGELDEGLKQALTNPEYGFDGKGRIQLEKKKDMKARGLESGDDGDALVLTHAWPVHSADEQMSLVERKLQEQKAASPAVSWMAR